ncbi:MAG: hypothetical protein WCO06_06050 [Candidatus Roizmanbacteria bacterium]
MDANRVVQIMYNPVFGKLTPLEIKNASSSAGIDFILDTIEGKPVTATEAAKVYFIPEPETKLGFKQKIKTMAKVVNIDSETIRHKLTNLDAVYEDGLSTMSINISNYNFKYEYNFQQNPDMFQQTAPIEQSLAEQSAKELFTQLDRYPTELAQGQSQPIYFIYDPLNNAMQVTDRPEKANLIEIDYFRPEINSFSIVSPKFFNSQNFALIANQEGIYRVLRAQIKFFEKSDQQVGLYPVITGDEAFQKLKDGKALIISNPNNSQSVTIKNMFMAYFDPDTYQQYLQPVYVFVGDNDFVAYVQAVSDSYIEGAIVDKPSQ